MNLDTRRYLSQLFRPNNPTADNWSIRSASPASGDTVWRCVFVRRLSDDENQGNHNVYIDLIDRNGLRIDVANGVTLRYKWTGMRDDESPPPLIVEKPSPEPGMNFPIFRGMDASCQLSGVSDEVYGLNAENGHTSYYVVFQIQQNQYIEVTPPHQPNMIIVPLDTILAVEAALKRLQEASDKLR